MFAINHDLGLTLAYFTANSIWSHGLLNGKGSVSASGTGQIRLKSPRPAVPDTEPILTGMAPCPALYFSYQFLGCK